jgi:hypothetical protein
VVTLEIVRCRLLVLVSTILSVLYRAEQAKLMRNGCTKRRNAAQPDDQ